MFQVAVLPPTDSMRAIEGLRRLHDPAFHRVAAHLALLPPFDVSDARLLDRFDALHVGDAFDIEFGPPTAVGDALCLPVARGEQSLLALRAALAAALLPPLGEAPSAAPALRVGLFGGASEIELARRALATLPPPPALRVREVVLLVEDARGLWHEARTKKLRSRTT